MATGYEIGQAFLNDTDVVLPCRRLEDSEGDIASKVAKVMKNEGIFAINNSNISPKLEEKFNGFEPKNLVMDYRGQSILTEFQRDFVNDICYSEAKGEDGEYALYFLTDKDVVKLGYVDMRKVGSYLGRSSHVIFGGKLSIYLNVEQGKPFQVLSGNLGTYREMRGI